jgi:hypothetical protein
VRYLKKAWWGTIEGDTGYFVTVEGHNCPIEFNHDNTYWEDVGYSEQESCWITDGILTKDQGLEITQDEIVHRDELGRIDGQDADDSDSGVYTTYNTPFAGIISQITDREPSEEPADIQVHGIEEQEEGDELANRLSKIHIPQARPLSRNQSITALMATMTEPTPTVSTIRCTGPPLSQWGRQKGNLFGRITRDPPDADPIGGGGSGGGGGGSGDGGGDGGGGGGGGGNAPNPPLQQANQPHGGQNKLMGKKPQIFTGDRSKVEGFLLEWNIYHGLNHYTDIMTQAFTRSMIFLSYIKGDDVYEWVSSRVQWLADQLAQGSGVMEEYLFNTVMAQFRSAFTDTQQRQKAQNELEHLRMQGGDLDGYVSEFE